jgi:glycosyltransferase involved in cell wall biosynthesis
MQKTPRRILFLQSQAHWSPTATVQHLLASHLDRGSFEVHVACAIGPRGKSTPAYTRYQATPDIHLRPTNFGTQIFEASKVAAAKGLVSTSLAVPVTLLGLVRYARSHGIDIVHASEHPRDVYTAAVISRLTNARHVVHLHAKCAEWMRPTVRRLMTQADGIVGVSQFTASSATAIGCKPDRIHHALSAMESSSWDFRIDSQSLQQEFEIPTEALIFATVGDARPWKGQELTMRALAEIKDRIPEFRYLVVGSLLDGIDETYGLYLKTLVHELGLGREVIFTGRRSDVPVVLAACDFLVLPFFDEGFGLAILEAMAMKKAVIALDSGGPRELVEHGKSGLLSAPDDVDGLAGSIETLATDGRLRAEMGAYGRRRVEEYFTPQRLASDFERIYREILAGS